MVSDILMPGHLPCFYFDQLEGLADLIIESLVSGSIK
jgi:hypothetical protein